MGVERGDWRVAGVGPKQVGAAADTLKKGECGVGAEGGGNAES